MKTTYFKEADFNKLDWSKLKRGKYATNGENYSLAKGGAGYPGGSGWIIVVYLDDDSTQEWQLPALLTNIIDAMNVRGRHEKLKEIQNMLGI